MYTTKILRIYRASRLRDFQWFAVKKDAVTLLICSSNRNAADESAGLLEDNLGCYRGVKISLEISIHTREKRIVSDLITFRACCDLAKPR